MTKPSATKQDMTTPVVWGARVATVFVALSAGASAAISSLGEAKVMDRDGVPCFSISEAPAPTALRSLSVSETKSADWRTLPAALWAIEVVPPGAAVDWRASDCIAYGHAPAGVDTRVAARPLQLHWVYSVAISARGKRDRGNVLAHRAEFCVIEADGRTVAREVPWDAVASKWRYDVCEKK